MREIVNRPLQEQVASITGRKVQRMLPLAGGMISSVLQIELTGGDSIVAKLGSPQQHDLRIEAYMLRYLRQHSRLPVPRVLHAQNTLLLMEYIAGSSGGSEWNAASEAHLGELLAECHQIRAAAYGLERDTLIGPLPQPNPPSASWIDFFRQHRLLYMTDIALKSSHLPAALGARLQDFAAKLENVLIEPAQPALIHGDVWRANILVRAGRVVGIIDPALYYAHHEMELAYMTLFDSVGADFFASYQQTSPIDPEFFELRRHVYSLYPLLVHITIFGEKYIEPLTAVLRRFGH